MVGKLQREILAIGLHCACNEIGCQTTNIIFKCRDKYKYSLMMMMMILQEKEENMKPIWETEDTW